MNHKSMKRLKNNRFVRGLYFALRRNFCHGKRSFGHLSDNVILTPPLWLGNPKNIFIYDDVGIGMSAVISAINAKFICKGHCAIAEHFTVHTGNHVHVPGKFITDITEANKPAGYDKDVTVEEDVWIGCNVTLLSGVTIGRGCTVAAGAVVAKSMPPYTIVAGVPAKPIKMKWSIDEILQHERALYPEHERLSRKYLEDLFETINQ